MSKNKKIIFVIVEGPSDEIALGLILDHLFADQQVLIKVMHGDITSDRSSTPTNILSRIGNIIRSYAKSNHFTQKDFCEVIHLVDMDGAYISPDHIVQDESFVHPFYTQTEIHTKNKEGIRLRNEKKRLILDKISSLDSVWKIPYRVFYFSCNLDHVLYDKQNSNDSQKEKDSYKFSKAYKDHVSDFLEYICHSSFSVDGDYPTSWDFIKKDLHSLERHTNLGVWFKLENLVGASTS